ncbi:hypothetical protein ALC56_12619 [Trachymyrmex septentrionalis]|uniref:BEN domain-containing protein n=1 Tax=Trachymyrmex septentrionalis TaxID=34720 RepID=A0A195EXH6_9HYME|nr:hypothetical protein ALC56_12619 [Trachymyrmex septentrionalis]
MITARRVRRGRPRLGTRGGKHSSPSVHRNSPSRSDWLGPLDMRTTPPAAMPAFRGFEESSSDGVVHLGEGIAVCEEQLRAVKWSDYRKLTRGLAAILFSPTELATCSVTGQRWSRAGTATERPVKPALDKAKVQAIIISSRITATRSLVRSEKGVTFKSMHETAAISDTVLYDAENRFEKLEYITIQTHVKYQTLKHLFEQLIDVEKYNSLFSSFIDTELYKKIHAVRTIAADSNMSRIASFYPEQRLSLLEISNPLSKLRADFLPFPRRGKLLISLQPGTNGGIIAIHGIRVGALNVKAYGNRSASVKRMVNEGSSEHDGGGGGGGGSGGAGGGSSDNTYNVENVVCVTLAVEGAVDYCAQG